MFAKWCTMSNDRQNFAFSCSHISVVWLHGLNTLQWWLMTRPDLKNVVWFKTILTNMNIQTITGTSGQKRWNTRYPKYPMILRKKIGYGLGIAKNYRVGSGIRYPSGTGYDTVDVTWSTTQWRKARLSEEKYDSVKKSPTQWRKVRPSEEKYDPVHCKTKATRVSAVPSPVLPAATVSGDKNEMMTFLVQPPVICFSTQTKVPGNKLRSCTSILYVFLYCHWCPFLDGSSQVWQFCSCTTLWALFEAYPQIQLL